MGKKVTNIVMAAAGGLLAFQLAPAALAGLGLYALVGGGILAGYLVGDLLTPNFKTPDSTPSGQTIRGSKVAARYAFGKFSTGGFLFFAQEQAGEQDKNEWIHLAFAISEGAIEGIDEIYLDEIGIDSYGIAILPPNYNKFEPEVKSLQTRVYGNYIWQALVDMTAPIPAPTALSVYWDRREKVSKYLDIQTNVSYEVHINRTTPDPFMLANCSNWKDTMIGRNLSWVRVSLKFNQDLFTGLPSFRFVGRGLPVYDPRIDSIQYTDNPSLINRHILNNILKVPENEIIDEYFIESANISDEIVINPDGSSSKRYTMGCLVGDDENRVDILKKIELATNGHSIRLAGRWGFLVGAYYGAYDLTVTHDDIIGQIEYQTEASNADAINTVTGTFIDPNNSYQDTDYPPAVVDEWVTADNAELVEDLNLKYVNDPYLAQRLAWMKLKQRRNASTVTLNMNYSGYACRPMRVVRLYLPKFNIDGEFIVTNWQMTPPAQANEDGAIAVTFQAYDSDMFDDAVGSTYEPLGFISLPTGGLAAPSNLVWIPDGKSDVMQGYLSWAAASDTVNYYSVLIRDSIGDLIQTYQVVGSATICNINGLQAGTYTMSIFAVSGILKSSEISVVVDINVPAEPQIVTYSNTIDSITIYASNPLAGKNDWNYEHYFSNNAITNPLTEATRLGTGATITKHGLAFDTTYHFYIRTFNAYGYSGFYHLVANTSNNVSALISALEGQITESELAVDLATQIGDAIAVGNELAQLQIDIDSLTIGVNNDISDLEDYFNTQINMINATLADITSATPYSSSETSVLEGAFRTLDGKLYRALQNMTNPIPAPIVGGTNSYWTYIGDYTSISDVVDNVSAQLITLQTAVDGQVQAITSLRASSRENSDSDNDALVDALYQVNFKAKFEEEVTARISEDEALAERITIAESSIDDNIASIQQIEQTIVDNESATATHFESLESTLDSTTGIATGNSEAISLLQTRVTDTEDGIVVIGQDITSLNATVELNNIKPRIDDEGLLVEALNSAYLDANIKEERTIRITEDEALAANILNLSTSVNENASKIFNETVARTDADSALAYDITQLESDVYNEITGLSATANALSLLSTDVYDATTGLDSKASASSLTALEAIITNPDTGLSSKASAEDLTTVEATLDDVTAERTLKVQARTDGKLVTAGIGLIASGSTEQSEVYVLADKFAVLNNLNGTITSPFIVDGTTNTTYLSNAMIANGTIGSAKIADSIQSSNYSAGNTGWQIKKDGSAEFNNVLISRPQIEQQGIATNDGIISNWTSIGTDNLYAKQYGGWIRTGIILPTVTFGVEKYSFVADVWALEGFTLGTPPPNNSPIVDTYTSAKTGRAGLQYNTGSNIYLGNNCEIFIYFTCGIIYYYSNIDYYLTKVGWNLKKVF